MTVQTTTSRADYTGNGSTTAFTVPFYFLDNTHLQVLRTQISTGVITTLALTTDYTVTGAGVSAGGTVTCLVAPTTDQKISILRAVPLTQLVHYVPNDPFPAATHEQALDQLTMEVQQVNEAVGRAFVLPANTTGVSTTLPYPSSNKFIGWNQTATGLQNVDPTTLATIVAYGTTNADVFTGTGAQTAFTLTANPGAQANLDVSVGGVTQIPGVDYTWISGTTLTFTTAPPNGVKILARYFQGLPQGYTDSAASSFLQSGTGAVTRFVRDKLRETVSVKDFGAVGDGVTDDTAAIQAAVSAAYNVFVPQGTYKLTSAIAVPSNTRVYGAGAASILKAATDGMFVISIGQTASRTGIILENFAIDGGGQTTNTATGVKAVTGIYASWVTNLRINNVTLYKLGVINAGSPTTDAAYAGCGIDIQSTQGAVSNVRVTNCSVSFVAGGGTANGDAYYIAGVGGNYCTDIVVENCWASTVGRHCYTIAGTASLSSGIKFINCYGEKSALDGVDIEDGTDVRIDGCNFTSCGNDQTYFNPVAAFGATYRLLAGVAISSLSNSITISKCKFTNCYYGVTEGGSNGLIISECIFESSPVSDLKKGLAASTFNMKLINCQFKTVANCLDYYNTASANNLLVEGCTFAGLVSPVSIDGGTFSNCVFNKGFTFTGGSGSFKNVKWIGCTWNDYAGVGLYPGNINLASTDCSVIGCVFNGTGNMTYGIQLSYNSTYRWVIKGCTFRNCTGSGIDHQNTGEVNFASVISGNTFDGCAQGISLYHGPIDCVISDNVFYGCTNYAFTMTAVNAAQRFTLANNVVATGCTNGFTLSGTWDYSIVVGNNVHGASGTKWNVSGGQNVNGVTANNITV